MREGVKSNMGLPLQLEQATSKLEEQAETKKQQKSDLNSTPGMAPNVAPTKKGASSYVSHYAAVRDTIGLPHIDLIGSTSRIHSQNGRTERYFQTRHKFVSQLESERYQPPCKRSLASVATPEKVRVRFPWAKILR